LISKEILSNLVKSLNGFEDLTNRLFDALTNIYDLLLLGQYRF
jgi:hypothetical protein